MNGEHERPVFGVTENRTWERDVQSDGKRAYDAAAKRRQKERSDNAPEPMFPDLEEPLPPGRLRSGLIHPSHLADPFVPGRRRRKRPER